MIPPQTLQITLVENRKTSGICMENPKICLEVPALNVCNTNLLDSGAVVQSMQGKQESSLLTEINGRLHQGYRTLSGSVAMMQQVKVARHGPNGQPLTAATAKSMLTRGHWFFVKNARVFVWFHEFLDMCCQGFITHRIGGIATFTYILS